VGGASAGGNGGVGTPCPQGYPLTKARPDGPMQSLPTNGSPDCPEFHVASRMEIVRQQHLREHSGRHIVGSSIVLEPQLATARVNSGTRTYRPRHTFSGFVNDLAPARLPGCVAQGKVWSARLRKGGGGTRRSK
jgi:hypothetical protein